jgi:hypothetical protein
MASNVTVYCVEKKIFPFKFEPDREYFFDADLADKVCAYYQKHMDEVPFGIDTRVTGPFTERAIQLKNGSWRLQFTSPNSCAIDFICTKFDIVKRAEKLRLWGQCVESLLQEDQGKGEKQLEKALADLREKHKAT